MSRDDEAPVARRRTGYNWLAPIYFPLEWLMFGHGLRKCRSEAMEDWLQILARAKRVLIVGDGSGHFLRSILRSNSSAQVTSVDFSEAMISRQRLAVRDPDASRVNFVCEDILIANLPDDAYDAIVLPFVMDCFDETQIQRIVTKLRSTIDGAGTIHWMDFIEPVGLPTGLRLIAEVRLIAMHWLFWILTGLPNRRLVPVSSSFVERGFTVKTVRDHNYCVQSRVYQLPSAGLH